MFDVVTAVWARNKSKQYTDQCISQLPKGMVYKGAVDYQSSLPTTRQETGDCYTVKYKGTSGTEPWGAEFCWGNYEGTDQWIQLGGSGSEYTVTIL